MRVLDRIDQFVFLKDTRGIYRYANEPFAKIAGLHSPADVVGKSDYDLSWCIDADLWSLGDSEVLAGKAIVRAEETYRNAGGDLKIIITRAPYRKDDGEIIGVLGNFRDCTGQLILETSGTFDEDKHRLHLEFVPEWLSAAEVRICFYLIHGFSAPRISEKTGTSVSTVRFHIDNIKNKMHCKNKSEIVDITMRTGIAWKIFSLQHVEDIGLSRENDHDYQL
jgi:PAS domain S-box-containing protein